MATISKAQLANLLHDLYDIFNPDHKQYVNGLADRYIDLPFEAVDMVLFKYNQSNLDFYDPTMDSVEYKMRLVADYSKGLRTLQDLDITKRKDEIKKQEESVSKAAARVEAERQASLQKELESKTSQIQQKTSQEIDAIKREMEKALEEIKKIRNEARQNPEEDGVVYQIKVNYSEDKVIFPNAKRLSGLGIGARVVAKTEGGKPIGLIVKDITYDDISHPEGKTIIDVILDKG